MDSGMKPWGADCHLFVCKEEHRRGRISFPLRQPSQLPSDPLCGECCNLMYRRIAKTAPLTSSYQPQLCVSSGNSTPSHSLWWMMSVVWNIFFWNWETSLIQKSPPAPSLCLILYKKGKGGFHGSFVKIPIPLYAALSKFAIYNISMMPCLFGTYCTYWWIAEKSKMLNE